MQRRPAAEVRQAESLELPRRARREGRREWRGSVADVLGLAFVLGLAALGTRTSQE